MADGWEGLDEAFLALETECAAVVRGITVEAWSRVLAQTPQYYGRAVASWTYSIGSREFVDRSGDIVADGADWKSHDQVKAKGDMTAINVANSFSTGHELPFQLGDNVFFANGVDHGQGPYAQGLEDASINLRAVNRPGQMVSRAIDFITSKYGRDVTPSNAVRLRDLRIGI